MKSLSVAEAITAVRKNLDEQGLNDSAMYIGETEETEDNTSFDKVIESTLSEAIDSVNEQASLGKLEGEETTKMHTEINNGVVTLKPDLTNYFLRLVSFRIDKGSKLVTEVVDEASVEGKQQSNPYLGGTDEQPTLILMQGSERFEPIFLYYSLPKDFNEDDTIEPKMVYVRKSKPNTNGTYDVAEALVDATLYQLTAMVLAIYKDADMAKYFFELAKTKM